MVFANIRSHNIRHIYSWNGEVYSSGLYAGNISGGGGGGGVIMLAKINVSSGIKPNSLKHSYHCYRYIRLWF